MSAAQLHAEPEAYARGYHRVVERVRITGRYGRYSLGFVPEGKEARQITGGPQVPGPWATIGEMATVIAAHALPDTDTVVELAIGDTITIDGVEFTLTEDRYRRPSLVL